MSRYRIVSDEGQVSVIKARSAHEAVHGKWNSYDDHLTLKRRRTDWLLLDEAGKAVGTVYLLPS